MGLAAAVAVLIVAGVLAFMLRPTAQPPKVAGSTQVTSDGLDKERIVTDGLRIYYSSCSAVGCSLYEGPAAGGDSVPIQTPLPNPYVRDISPDRSELLVSSCVNLDNNMVNCPVWVLPVLGSSPRRVGDIRANDAVWSRDGKDVFYTQADSIYRVKVDGGESEKFVSVGTGKIPFSLCWSPDGSRLRFTVRSQDYGLSIWEVSAHGSDLHRVLPSAFSGTWTPDGRYFLFDSGRRGAVNIWAIREGRSFFRRVRHEPVQLTAGPTSVYDPSPSIDGKKVFVSTFQGQGELLRYDSASHEFTPYLAGISATGLNFSPDGKSLAYVSFLSERSGVAGWTAPSGSS